MCHAITSITTYMGEGSTYSLRQSLFCLKQNSLWVIGSQRCTAKKPQQIIWKKSISETRWKIHVRKHRLEKHITISSYPVTCFHSYKIFVMGLWKRNALIYLTDWNSHQLPQPWLLYFPLLPLICPRKDLFGGQTQILLTDFMHVVPSFTRQPKRSPPFYGREGKLVETCGHCNWSSWN